MNTRLTALLAMELDSIPCPHDRAKRLAEILRAASESWVDNLTECEYRVTLTNAAADLDGTAKTMLEIEAEREAERDYMQRRRMTA